METVKTAMNWAVLYMLHYPEVLKNVQNELDQVHVYALFFFILRSSPPPLCLPEKLLHSHQSFIFFAKKYDDCRDMYAKANNFYMHTYYFFCIQYTHMNLGETSGELAPIMKIKGIIMQQCVGVMCTCVSQIEFSSATYVVAKKNTIK